MQDDKAKLNLSAVNNKDNLMIVECLKKIQIELPRIYQQYIQLVPAIFKHTLEDEKEFINAISEEINDFFAVNINDQSILDKFAKFILSALEKILRRLEQIQCEFLPTKAINDLASPLRVLLTTLISTNSQDITFPSQEVLIREHAAFEMQSELNRQGIKQILVALRAYALKSKLESKTVFISYAWPKENVHREEWSKEFVFNLADHLEMAGLEVVLDRKQSSSGSPLLEFMRDNILKAQHIIVICNRSMQYKFEADGATGVFFEYLQMMNRWRKEKPRRFIIPFCLTKDNYVPGLVGKFAGVSTYEDGYIKVLKELIARIYGFNHTLDEWWRDNIECLKVSTLPRRSINEQSTVSTVIVPSPALSTRLGMFTATAVTGNKDVIKEQSSLLKASAMLPVMIEDAIVTESVRANILQAIKFARKDCDEIIANIRCEAPIKRQLAETLNLIDFDIQVINKYLGTNNPEIYFTKIKDLFQNIDRNTSNLFCEAQSHDRIFANKLRSLIKDAVVLTHKAIEQRLTIPNFENMTQRTQRLYLQQGYIKRTELSQALNLHLNKVKDLIYKNQKLQGLRLFISYAWPTEQNKDQEKWLQPFLFILREHLQMAGVKAVLDIADNKPGDSIVNFTRKAEESEFVLLICTESLRDEYRSSNFKHVQIELTNIIAKRNLDNKVYGDEDTRVFPALVSCAHGWAYPEHFQLTSLVRDWRDNSYVTNLEQLLLWIYRDASREQKRIFQEMWQEFYKRCSLQHLMTADQIKEELNVAWHQQVQKKLSIDNLYREIQAQMVIEPSSALAADINLVYMKYQGTSAQLSIDSYGKLFQKPPINEDFIERKELLTKLYEHFNKSDHQILTLTAHGLGGVGKTQLAQFFYLHPPRPYTLRAWFQAETKEQLYIQYINLANENGLLLPNELKIEERVKKAKEWLEQQKDCLLIYDNVPNQELLEDLLPQHGKHHILITSRNETGWNANQKLDVDVMEEHEAIALIQKITGRNDNLDDLKLLVKTLGSLPLALAQAGAYMREKSLDVKTYLARYQQHQVVVMNYTDGLPKDVKKDDKWVKHEAVWVTFDMNFKALTSECSPALLTLKQASWLSGTPIPEMLFELLVMANFKQQSPDLLWDDIKNHLKRYSLMRIDVTNHQLTIHNLLQDILRFKQIDSEKLNIFKLLCEVLDGLYVYYNEQGSLAFKALLSHAERLQQHGQKLSQLPATTEVINPMALACEPCSLGSIYQHMGLSTKMLSNYKNRLSILEKCYGASHPVVAITKNNLSTAYGDIGDAHKQKELIESALPVLEKYFGSNHLEVARAYNHLSNAYGTLDFPEKQKQLAERALLIISQCSTFPISEKIKILSNLANAYGDLGNAQKQKEILEKVVNLEEEYYGKSHPELGRTLNDLSNAYSALGDHQKQKELLQRALPILEQHYGSDHSEVANVLCNLGIAYAELGDPQQAKPLLERSLIIKEKYYGNTHSEMAAPLVNLMNVHSALNEKEQALNYLYRARNIYQINFPEGHLNLIYLESKLQRLTSHNAIRQQAVTSVSMPQNVSMIGPRPPLPSNADSNDQRLLQNLFSMLSNIRANNATLNEKSTLHFLVAAIYRKYQNDEIARYHYRNCYFMRFFALGTDNPETHKALKEFNACRPSQP
jgi:hypothetical protein